MHAGPNEWVDSEQVLINNNNGVDFFASGVVPTFVYLYAIFVLLLRRACLILAFCLFRS